MEDFGLLKTNTFGGFNKKDVYKFFNKVNEQTKKEIDDYKGKMFKLASEYENLKKQSTKQSEQIASLTERLEQAELFQQQLDEIKGENNQLKEKISQAATDGSYKQRCDLMSQKIIALQSDIEDLNYQIDGYKVKNARLDEMIDKISALDFNVLDRQNEAIEIVNSLSNVLINIQQIVNGPKEIDELNQCNGE